MGDFDVIEMYRRKDGKWDWHRKDGGNHEIIATSGGQGYERLATMQTQLNETYGDTVDYKVVG
jgi:uncharacterized protein YegP (UPF0339 family)